MAISAGGYLLKAAVVFFAQLLHPFCGFLLMLRMILVLPRSGGGLQGLDLATRDLLLGRLREKRAAIPLG